MSGSIDFLNESIQFLKGVGPRRSEAMENHGIRTVNDLLQFYPRRYLDRATVTPIKHLTDSSGPTTVVGTVISAGTVRRGRRRFEVVIRDESLARLKCVWFRRTGWVEKVFSVGDRVAFHGRPQKYGRDMNMVHPDFDKLDEDGPSLDTGRIIALYSGSADLQETGTTSKTLRRVIYGLFKDHGTRIPEILPESIRTRFQLLDGRVARRAIHFPKSQSELDAARRRLKFEELFFVQLMLAKTRQLRNREPGLTFDAPGLLCQQFMEAVLPFSLTNDQRRVAEEIFADCSSGRQMNRLLQGDVGCGKTVVAILALLHAIENGYQTAIMAPTEILAEQHYQSISGYMDALNLETTLLKGQQKAAVRRSALEAIGAGKTKVTVGTHALIQEGVAFDNLGLVVVDEQHRFGVMQRLALREKGRDPHMLLMTATPIPRSLALTLYGDLDVSVIREMPPGRKPVRTVAKKELERSEAYDLIREQIESGNQAYIVYPLVEESEKLDLKDAQTGFEKVVAEFPGVSVGLVHGRMKPAEKDDVMRQFKNGDLKIVVSTTVIEVGVDVPGATVMVIEHAERFGLSQLHQLRGRVGRSTEQSYCILMYDYPVSEDGRIRIDTMVSTNDGFKVSETDLRLRGAGDFFGTRQSGLPEFKIADLASDGDVLMEAREAVEALMSDGVSASDEEKATLSGYFSTFVFEEQAGMIRI
ncbi:MAG: ATP-dependent DNA helicase RecG [Rhodothermales bacterium]|nr:ATP-dependent DNA helicase RecG [Rhodothermales bacterium]